VRVQTSYTMLVPNLSKLSRRLAVISSKIHVKLCPTSLGTRESTDALMEHFGLHIAVNHL
jgi:hypothetical protein